MVAAVVFSGRFSGVSANPCKTIWGKNLTSKNCFDVQIFLTSKAFLTSNLCWRQKCFWRQTCLAVKHVLTSNAFSTSNLLTSNFLTSNKLLTSIFFWRQTNCWRQNKYWRQRIVDVKNVNIFLLTSKTSRCQKSCWRQKKFWRQTNCWRQETIDVKKIVDVKKFLTSKTFLRSTTFLTSKAFFDVNSFSDVKEIWTSRTFLTSNFSWRQKKHLTSEKLLTPKTWRQQFAGHQKLFPRIGGVLSSNSLDQDELHMDSYPSSNQTQSPIFQNLKFESRTLRNLKLKNLKIERFQNLMFWKFDCCWIQKQNTFEHFAFFYWACKGVLVRHIYQHSLGQRREKNGLPTSHQSPEGACFVFLLGLFWCFY